MAALSDFGRYSYGPVAAFYEEAARIYSAGRIPESKRIQLAGCQPGDSVLYAGAGRGEDVVEAARRGLEVTAIDVSNEMLDRLRARLSREGLEARLILGDVSEHHPDESYDVIAANYFLNLFDCAEAERMLAILVRWLKPGGVLMLADFALPRGGWLPRLVSELYYRPLNGIAWLLGFCAWHPIHDYSAMLDRLGFEIRWSRRLGLCPGLSNPAYVSLRAARRQDPS